MADGRYMVNISSNLFLKQKYISSSALSSVWLRALSIVRSAASIGQQHSTVVWWTAAAVQYGAGQ